LAAPCQAQTKLEKKTKNKLARRRAFSEKPKKLVFDSKIVKKSEKDRFFNKKLTKPKMAKTDIAIRS